MVEGKEPPQTAESLKPYQTGKKSRIGDSNSIQDTMKKSVIQLQAVSDFNFMGGKVILQNSNTKVHQSKDSDVSSPRVSSLRKNSLQTKENEGPSINQNNPSKRARFDS